MDVKEKIDATKANLRTLKQQISDAHQKNKTKSLSDVAASRSIPAKSLKLAKRRDLIGHFGKVFIIIV
jgi:hypothetical protein